MIQFVELDSLSNPALPTSQRPTFCLCYRRDQDLGIQACAHLSCVCSESDWVPWLRIEIISWKGLAAPKGIWEFAEEKSVVIRRQPRRRCESGENKVRLSLLQGTGRV